MVAKFVDPNKPWTCKYGRKKRVSCVLCDSTQEQKRRSILFFHCSTIEMAVSVKNDCWDPGIFLPWQCEATLLRLHMELKQPQRLRQGERSWQIVVAPFQTLRRAICPMLHPQVLHSSSVKKVKLVVVCLYKTFHWYVWRFNRAVTCSTDEFCSASDEINAGSPSWMLRLTEGWGESKTHS